LLRKGTEGKKKRNTHERVDQNKVSGKKRPSMMLSEENDLARK